MKSVLESIEHTVVGEIIKQGYSSFIYEDCSFRVLEKYNLDYNGNTYKPEVKAIVDFLLKERYDFEYLDGKLIVDVRCPNDKVLSYKWKLHDLLYNKALSVQLKGSRLEIVYYLKDNLIETRGNLPQRIYDFVQVVAKMEQSYEKGDILAVLDNACAVTITKDKVVFVDTLN